MQYSVRIRLDLRSVIGRTRCDQRALKFGVAMLRWLIVVFVALIIFSRLQPWLSRIGLGRLPGDFRFRFFGHDWLIPISSSVVISVFGMLVGKLF